MGVIETGLRVGRELVSVLLPSPCVVCGEELPMRNRRGSCCGTCWDALPRLTPPRCERCALPWETTEAPASFTCTDCVAEPPPLDWIDAWGRYEKGLAELLQAFKFRGHDFLSRHLGELLAEVLDARDDRGFDLIVPVPMHRAKRRQRGYNQAALLARALARRTGIAVAEDVLVKQEERETQASLPKAARRTNVRGAYAAEPRVKGLRVLLVDDIATTGETIRACALELQRRKARGVAALVVARTP
ncbi:MAG: ComF family protein [Thermoanaerobaculia bacterium]|nr:ComF family protein [Thermoanaerobaculia bacterium]